MGKRGIAEENARVGARVDSGMNAGVEQEAGAREELFGDCLAALLDERKHGNAHGGRMSATWLADQLGVDASLVHHWRANRRVPQREYLERVGVALHLSAAEQRRLQDAYTTSLRARKSGDLRPGKHQRSLAIRFPAPRYGGLEPLDPARVPARLRTEPLPDEVRSVEGIEAVVRLATRLLLSAPALSHPHAKSVYLTYAAGTRDVVGEAAPEAQAWFRAAVRQALWRGWDVRSVLHLDRNVRRSVEMIEAMHAYLGAPGSYLPYYLLQDGMRSAPFSVCVVPDVGALLLVMTHAEGDGDSAIYFPARGHTAEVHVLAEHCEALLSPTYSTRLLEVFGKSVEGGQHFDERVQEVEAAAGNRFLVNDGLNDGLAALMRPPALAERGSAWLARNALGRHASTGRHSPERIQTLYRNLRQYRYQDVWSKGAVQRLLSSGGGTSEVGRGNDGALRASPEEWREYLWNIIHVLEEYSNFELALVDEDEERELLRSRWEVVGDAAVLLETWKPGEQGEATDEELQLLITEPSIIHAYHEYGQELWQRIRPHNREREYVVWWLRQRLNGLNEM